MLHNLIEITWLTKFGFRDDPMLWLFGLLTLSVPLGMLRGFHVIDVKEWLFRGVP
jgi:hypothetical protein